jgi:hypothetical protein
MKKETAFKCFYGTIQIEKNCVITTMCVIYNNYHNLWWVTFKKQCILL